MNADDRRSLIRNMRADQLIDTTGVLDAVKDDYVGNLDSKGRRTKAGSAKRDRTATSTGKREPSRVEISQPKTPDFGVVDHECLLVSCDIVGPGPLPGIHEEPANQYV